MFRETLIESSPQPRKRRGWSMATALALQVIAVTVLIVTPLITTGVIPLSAHTIVFTPPTYTPPPAVVRVPQDQGVRGPSRDSAPMVTRVVPFYNNGPSKLPYGPIGQVLGDPPPSDPPPGYRFGSDPGIPRLNPGHSTVDGPPRRVPISWLSEAWLINKVIPEYPMLAQRAGVQGDVKLRAIISRDGSIQSLSLVSGHPLLAKAAITAVEQWRYHPYVLDGDPVEVETWITVSFKRNQ